MASRLLLAGLTGSAVAAVCCTTAILPAVLMAIGAGALVPVLYRDAVLLPLLGGFLLLTGFALWRRSRRS